jgi:hypothetical protein
MLERAIAAHLRWLSEHANVYHYLKRNSLPSSDSAESASTNVRGVVSAHTAQMLVDGSLGAEIPPATAHPLAYGLVGMVDAAAAHWLDEPHGADVEALGAQLTEACWAVIRVTVGSGVVEALDRLGAESGSGVL